jgi:alpha-L-fucosidase
MQMSRRHILELLAGAGGGLLSPSGPAIAQRADPNATDDTRIAEGPFQGNRASLEHYEVPQWFRDAKFGIWAHWGPQSAIEAGDWYARNMYIQGSDQYNYHIQRFGHPSTFGYKDTIPSWKADKFDPAHLMKLYKDAGAKYFMSMAVHHDNFDMWNSRHHHWNAVAVGPHKDIVGLWRDAARREGLKFGVSDHLWISYKWFSVNHGSDAEGPHAGVPYDGADPRFRDLYIDSDQTWIDAEWNESGIPMWWKREWFNRIKDVVDNYELDLLYTDGPLPFEDYGYNMVAHLYNLSARRSGGSVEAVYFSKRDQDSVKGTCVLDRERGVLSEISPRPWQTDTCIGSWHYKLGQKYKTPKRVIDMLVDIVSRNGNLLLNFPLPASGELDLEEREILAGITEWMSVNGEAIFATRPWKISGEGTQSSEPSADGQRFNESQRHDLTAQDVRFTTKGSTLYVFVMGWPDYRVRIKSLAQDSPLQIGKIVNVELLGDGGKLSWQQSNEGLAILLPREAPSKYAVVFKVTGAL